MILYKKSPLTSENAWFTILGFSFPRIYFLQDFFSWDLISWDFGSPHTILWKKSQESKTQDFISSDIFSKDLINSDFFPKFLFPGFFPRNFFPGTFLHKILLVHRCRQLNWDSIWQFWIPDSIKSSEIRSECFAALKS